MKKVGKKIGQTLYIHQSAIDTLTNTAITLVNEAKKFLPNDFNFEILKINDKNKEVSFIDSPDWNTNHEPIVGDSYKINLSEGKLTYRKGREKNPQIYHHKWMFVKETYKGFDVEESRKRSKKWETLTIKINKKKIGNQDYWLNEVIPYIDKDIWKMKVPTPSNNDWTRGIIEKEAKNKFPELFNGTKEKSDKEYRNHPTQVKNTIRTYEKIYSYLSKDNFDGTILDASSGLGLGTLKGRELGFSVEDVEPFAPLSHKPTFTSYHDIDKQFDVIISNMVLNVIPQDTRDNLVRMLFLKLKSNGKMFFIVRGKNEIKKQKSGLPFHDDNKLNNEIGEFFFPNKKSYQKGFTSNELKTYVEDTLQNNTFGFTIERLHKANSNFKNNIGVIIKKNNI